MRKSKRALALIMALAMTTSLYACGNKNDNASSNNAIDEPAATPDSKDDN